MAKGQQRSTKEQKKPKSSDKKAKHLRPHELIQSSKLAAPRPGTKA